MTKDEMLWGNIRFLLLLIFSVAAIYIILCRYILNVPTEDSSELINEINHSERIFEIQHTHMQQAQNIWNEIDSLDFNIHHVDADNRANLLVISAASYWPLVSDPGYARNIRVYFLRVSQTHTSNFTHC